MRFTKLLLTLFTAFALQAGPGQAKPLSRIVAEVGLSPEDFRLMQEAAANLFEDGEPMVGNEGVWSNPKTGASGVVRLRDRAGSCVHLDHLIRSSDDEDVRAIRTRRCRDAEGKWPLTP